MTFGQEITELLGVLRSKRSPVTVAGLVEMRVPQDREQRILMRIPANSDRLYSEVRANQSSGPEWPLRRAENCGQAVSLSKIMTTEACWWSAWREVDGVAILHVELTPDAGRETRALALLDGEEKQRWQRFLSKRARCEFALCRAALRVALCERLGCSNHQLSFGYLAHGKPFAKVDGERVTAGFNVSHSGCHGLIAFADNEWLGVDVEERVPRRDLDGIGSLVYGPMEQRLLDDASGSQKMHLFFRLWSMKEALIKALGSGFSLNPAGFEVPLPMLKGVQSALFRFPHTPTDAWRLLDLGETRFAAALAYRLPSCSPLAKPDANL